MMAHQRPPIKPINPRSIPVPRDSKLKAEYLSLGWIELRGIFEGQPYLKWPFDLESPKHPGEKPQPAYVPPPLLKQLPIAMLDRARDSMSRPTASDPDECEVKITVLLRYKRKYAGSKRSSSRGYHWEAQEASFKVDE